MHSIKAGIYDKLNALISLGLLYRRHLKRINRWLPEYKSYLASGNARAPLPPAIQLIPTENCNLSCSMCNQWGSNGYFHEKKRAVSHMPYSSMVKFLDDFQTIRPGYLLSLHGGEPFVYKHIDPFLDYALDCEADKSFDIFFTTNGTMLGKHGEKLARLNHRVAYLISLDGDQKKNDLIRGKNATRRVIDSVHELTEACKSAGKGIPKIIINCCLSEYNLSDADNVYHIAKQVNAIGLNFNLRWFVTKEAGEAYDKLVSDEYNCVPTKAWTGWLGWDPRLDVSPVLKRIYKMKRASIMPLIRFVPEGLKFSQAVKYYADFNEVFGIEKCIMSSYLPRVLSNGDLIYCPGHPDVIPGNVFKQNFKDVYHNPLSTKLRKNMETALMPICNRCCGIYMNYQATRKLGRGFFVNSAGK